MTKGEQTRKKIVEAAAPIFNQHGYEGSSLNNLMEATGLKKGGIYRHFSSGVRALRSWLTRLQLNDEALRGVQSHLNQNIDNQVAASR